MHLFIGKMQNRLELQSINIFFRLVLGNVVMNKSTDLQNVTFTYQKTFKIMENVIIVISGYLLAVMLLNMIIALLSNKH